ncbi:IS30 family transposase [Streptomyces sp. NPDC093065]|uniref:IS30 family transposase n=1 Tax=Streptomyces sp. NPDC093065 TaxID=3366021 RepID=UPI00380D702D
MACNRTVVQRSRVRGGRSKLSTDPELNAEALRPAHAEVRCTRCPYRPPATGHRAPRATGRLGNWEGNLVVGARSQSAVATLVDRRTRYPHLVPLPERARRSLAWDQGSETARRHGLAPYFTDGIFFARPASPWERGTNEHTNGLIRQYLPKRTNLSLHTTDELRSIERRLNNRPRKRLSWQTPAQEA